MTQNIEENKYKDKNYKSDFDRFCEENPIVNNSKIDCKVIVKSIIEEMINSFEEGGMDCSYSGKNYNSAIDTAVEKLSKIRLQTLQEVKLMLPKKNDYLPYNKDEANGSKIAIEYITTLLDKEINK